MGVPYLLTKRVLRLGVGVLLASMAIGQELKPNEWVNVSENAVGPRFSPALVWSPKLEKFLLVGGRISHHFKGERPWDVQTFDVKDRKWGNHLPAGAEKLGGETGNVKDPGYQSAYFTMMDKAGMNRPNRRHMVMHYAYALPGWDDDFYGLVCGRTLKYDPIARTWKDMKPEISVLPPAKSFKDTLNWSALCADPVDRELLLFGGCGVLTEHGDVGTWVYSTEKNAWRDLACEKQPPPRALAPMAYDPGTKKIVLFGGDRLDQLWADTWVYDCTTRKWEERKPALSPSPRYGHALLYLPKARKIVLLGGKTYTSSTSYFATLYKPLPFECWTYDVAGNKWSLVKAWPKGTGPAMSRHRGNGVDSAQVAAVNDEDVVLWIGTGTKKKSPHSSWLCRLDVSATDAAGTARLGVKPGTLEYRTGSFDPEWYTKDVPPPDPAAAAAVLKNLVPNTWTSLQCPRWPENRQGGGWSTVAFDTDRDQILHMGGGHSSYFGNDMAHYDIKTGRWSIACRPMFALHYNYDLNGPGLWAFNGAPWGNHNYHAYAYDPTIKRVAYIKGSMTLLYDPVTRTWPHAEKFSKLPFFTSKYVNYLVSTPKGVICWTPTRQGSKETGLWRLENGKVWEEMKTSGDALPMTVCDGSTITFDSKRDCLWFTTSVGPCGQVWSADLKTGAVRKLDPTGLKAIIGKRFARESAYLPKGDLVMFGFLLEGEGGLVVPFYDCGKNRWLAAKMPGAEFMNGGKKAKPGSSVDLGLVYDPERDLVWSTLCELRRSGRLRVVKVDAVTLEATPLK